MKRYTMTLDGITLQTSSARRSIADSNGNPKPATTNPAEFAKAFSFALWCHRSSSFWLGDMLLTGLDLFGDDIWEHLECDMSVFDHLERCKGVSGKVPPQNRNENLSFTHHAFAATIPPSHQKAALEHAVDAGLNSAEFQSWIAEQRSLGTFSNGVE